MVDIYRKRGDLPQAKHFAVVAARQRRKALWSVPERRQALAEIEIRQGAWSEADRTYDRSLRPRLPPYGR